MAILEINYMKLFLKMVEIHSLNSCAEANARDFSGEIEQQWSTSTHREKHISMSVCDDTGSSVPCSTRD